MKKEIKGQGVHLEEKEEEEEYGQDPESQAGRQSAGYGGWCLELRQGWRYEEDAKSG